jgi:hypothetical protein
MKAMEHLHLEPAESDWTFTSQFCDPQRIFSTRCTHRLPGGEQCSTRVMFTAPYCNDHLALESEVRPGQTTLMVSEKRGRFLGLFMHCPNKVVKVTRKSKIGTGKGNSIKLNLPYLGLRFTPADFKRWFNTHTGPYVATTRNTVFDCALLRSAASLINSPNTRQTTYLGTLAVQNCRLAHNRATNTLCIYATRTIHDGDELFLQYKLDQSEYNTTHPTELYNDMTWWTGQPEE